MKASTVNFNTAKSLARGFSLSPLSGHLVTIESAGENACIQSLVAGMNVWLGGQYISIDSKATVWTEENGPVIAASSTYTNWVCFFALDEHSFKSQLALIRTVKASSRIEPCSCNLTLIY